MFTEWMNKFGYVWLRSRLRIPQRLSPTLPWGFWRTGTPPFWLSCWKVPLVWGPHFVWNYLLPSFVEVIISANIAQRWIKSHTYQKSPRKQPLSQPRSSFLPFVHQTIFILGCCSAAHTSQLFHIPESYFSSISPASAKGFIFVRWKGFKALSLSFEFGVDNVNHLMGIVVLFFQGGIILSKVWDWPEGDSQTSPGRGSILLFSGKSKRNRQLLPPSCLAWPQPFMCSGHREERTHKTRTNPPK